MSAAHAFLVRQIELIEANAMARERLRILAIVRAALPATESDYIADRVREATTPVAPGKGDPLKGPSSLPVATAAAARSTASVRTSTA